MLWRSILRSSVKSDFKCPEEFLEENFFETIKSFGASLDIEEQFSRNFYAWLSKLHLRSPEKFASKLLNWKKIYFTFSLGFWAKSFSTFGVSFCRGYEKCNRRMQRKLCTFFSKKSRFYHFVRLWATHFALSMNFFRQDCPSCFLLFRRDFSRILLSETIKVFNIFSDVVEQVLQFIGKFSSGLSNSDSLCPG